MSKNSFYFQSVQFSSIWPIDRDPYQVLPLQVRVGHGSDGNKEVLSIPQTSSITEALPQDCFSVIF